MLWTRLSPPMLEIVTSKADRAVMAVTIERDCPVCLGFVGRPKKKDPARHRQRMRARVTSQSVV